MNKSEQIRRLARSGETVATIARELKISYQFAYNVCKKAGLEVGTRQQLTSILPPVSVKPKLAGSMLLDRGFEPCGFFSATGGALTLLTLPRKSGVYAFAINNTVQYIGVATRSLSQRLYGYSKPSPTQKTNLRVNQILLQLIADGIRIDIYWVSPPDFEWNGFVISGPVGLEFGLILSYDLPWISEVLSRHSD